MPRAEFSKKTRVKAFERCHGKCEKCGCRLKVGEGEYDHILPAAFGGEATLENCQVLCVPCHRGPNGKTADDIRAIRKADRIKAKHIGAVKPSGFNRKWRKKMNGEVVPR